LVVAIFRADIVLCPLGRLCPSVVVELGAGPICRNLGDLKLAVIVWIGILLAIFDERGAVDNERKPCGVGRGRDIAAGRVGYLSDDAPSPICWLRSPIYFSPESVSLKSFASMAIVNG